MSRWSVFGGVIMVLIAGRVRADQDDVPVHLRAPDALFGADDAARHWLTATRTRVDIAGYPVGRYHTWHGRIGMDVAVAQIEDDAVYRMGLSMQTVADHRNDIAFRLVRLYYDTTQLMELRAGDGVAYLGLRHRCTHGADSAVDGRILIRSGPELGLHLQRSLGSFRLALKGFLHGTMIGQNDDPASKQRGLAAATLQASWHPPGLTLFASSGLGAALISSGRHRNFGFGSAYEDPELLPLPAAALGLVAHGREADFTSVLHFQRIMDSGFGARGDPTWLLAFELGFRN